MTIVTAWTLAAAVALVVNVWALWDVLRDLGALRRSGRNGVLRVIAHANLRREVLRLAMQGTFLWLGLLAFVDVATLRHVLAPVLLCVGIGQAVQILLDRSDRHHALRLLVDGAARHG